jgi:hypothetical protein
MGKMTVTPIERKHKTVEIYWIDPIRLGQIETLFNVERTYTAPEGKYTEVTVLNGPDHEYPEKVKEERIIPHHAVSEIKVIH